MPDCRNCDSNNRRKTEGNQQGGNNGNGNTIPRNALKKGGKYPPKNEDLNGFVPAESLYADTDGANGTIGRPENFVAGELVCHPESEWRRLGRYQITLYRDALIGEKVACLYSTIAHEFAHVLQELKSGGATRCGRS